MRREKTSYLVVISNSKRIRKDVTIRVLQPPDWNNEITSFEARKFVNVVVAIASIIHRT